MDQKNLEDREIEIVKREEALNKREAAVAEAEGIAFGQADRQTQEKKEPTKKEKALVEEACKAYGIEQQYIFHSWVGPSGFGRVKYGHRDDAV